MAMDRTTGPSLVAMHAHLSPESTLGTARPRKRLQKPCTKLPKQQQPQPQRHQQQLPTRPRLQVTFDESIENRPATASTLHDQAPPSRSIPRLQPPDLSDSKWAAYLGKGKGGIVGSMGSVAVPKDSLNLPSPMFPEFAHLAPGTAQPRPSTDSSSAPTSTTSSELVRARLRRQAKTPVSRIGQLESRSPRHSTSSSESRPKRQSAEAMAEEYRELLDAYEPSLSEDRPEQSSPPRCSDDHRRSPTPPRHSRAGSERSATPPPAIDLARCSPTSDDGTLVSFEDETIYFKPLSFGADSESSSAYCDFTVPPQRSITPAAPKSLGLQICMELLTRELSSAIFNQPGNGLSSLQIWAMIEAYERLRDQLRDSVSMPTEELQSVELMLDTWLRALYTIHDSLALDAQNGASRVDLDGLVSEELD